MSNFSRIARALALGAGAAAGLLALGQTAQAQDDPGERFMRIREESTQGPVRLELSIRTLRPSEDGQPTIHLVGVAHIAQPAYFRAIQAFLDKQDLVLFEGVGPDWMNVPEDATDERRAGATRGRMRFVAGAAERHRLAMGSYPASVEALLEGAPPYERRQIADAFVDGWDRPVHYSAGEGDAESYSMVSLGSDAEPGGTGAEADITLDDLGPISAGDPASGEGIQSQLASATGLVFQLDSIDYTNQAWVNADMTIDQLLGISPGDGLGGEGGAIETGDEGADAMIGMLSGDSMMAKLMGGVLKLIGSSEYSRSIFRLALIEMLGRSEELMELAAPQMGGDFFERIIDGRNEVVIDAVREASIGEDAPGSIAVFYGAGHMPGIEKTLVEEDGYRVSETMWLPAIVVDYDSSGIPPRQGAFFRSMISRSIDQQVRTMRRMTPRED